MFQILVTFAFIPVGFYEMSVSVSELKRITPPHQSLGSPGLVGIDCGLQTGWIKAAPSSSLPHPRLHTSTRATTPLHPPSQRGSSALPDTRRSLV